MHGFLFVYPSAPISRSFSLYMCLCVCVIHRRIFLFYFTNYKIIQCDDSCCAHVSFIALVNRCCYFISLLSWLNCTYEYNLFDAEILVRFRLLKRSYLRIHTSTVFLVDLKKKTIAAIAISCCSFVHSFTVNNSTSSNDFL